MNLKDKLEAESVEEPSILLYMEGVFWKAYEQSAMRFTKEIKGYRLLKKYVKTVRQEVVSMGFPDSSLTEILTGRNYERIHEKLIKVCTDTIFSPAEFSQWKQQIPLVEEGDTATSVSHAASLLPVELTLAERNVINQLKAFSVETASPIQCMILISNLQTILKQ